MNYKKQKKILFIHPYYGNGGSEKGISILSKSLTANGYKVDLAFINISDNSLFKKTKYINFLKLSSSRIITSLVPFTKIILENQYDIIIPTQSPTISFFTPLIYFLKIFGKNKSKTICFERLSPEIYFGKGLLSNLRKFIYFYSLRVADCILTNSLEQLISYRSILPKKLSFYIPNSSSCNHLVKKQKKDLVLNSKNDKKKLKEILWIGRLEKIKDPLFALDVINILDKEFRLNIYGDGFLKERLIKKVQELNLDKKVRFLSHRNLLDFKKYDIFLHTSYYEGLPNTFLESLYYNTPIVSTFFTTGLCELFIPYWIYPSARDKFEIRDRIIESLSKKDKNIRKNSNINSLIKEYYNESNMIENFQKVLKKIYKD